MTQVLNSEVNIDGYALYRSDRTRNGGGVLMYVNNCIGVKERQNFSKDTENIFVDILLPKTKPIYTSWYPIQPISDSFLTKPHKCHIKFRKL